MSEIQECEEAQNGNLQGTQVVGEERDVPQLLQEPIVKKVLIGVPLKGHTPPKSYHDRMMMFQYLGGREAMDFYQKKSPRYMFNFGAIGEMLVPYARERLAEEAVTSGCDYLFMVDDDMLTPPDLFFKLAENDKDICAALAFTRNPNHMPVVYEAKEGFDETTRTHYGFTRFVNNYPRNQLFQCDAVGFGAVLIKTEVFKKVPKPWFFGMSQSGEDITICTKAKKAGFEVWMDARIKLGHLGDCTIVTEEYSDRWNNMTPEEREKTYGKFQKYGAEV